MTLTVLLISILGLIGLIVLIASMVMVKGSDEPVPSEHIDMVV